MGSRSRLRRLLCVHECMTHGELDVVWNDMIVNVFSVVAAHVLIVRICCFSVSVNGISLGLRFFIVSKTFFFQTEQLITKTKPLSVLALLYSVGLPSESAATLATFCITKQFLVRVEMTDRHTESKAGTPTGCYSLRMGRGVGGQRATEFWKALSGTTGGCWKRRDRNAVQISPASFDSLLLVKYEKAILYSRNKLYNKVGPEYVNYVAQGNPHTELLLRPSLQPCRAS